MAASFGHLRSFHLRQGAVRLPFGGFGGLDSGLGVEVLARIHWIWRSVKLYEVGEFQVTTLCHSGSNGSIIDS